MTYTLTEDLRVADENGDPLSPRAIVDLLNTRDQLDPEDRMLVLHVIDFALEHDRLSRRHFGQDAALTTDSRIGINSLRAKIRATL